MRPVSLALPLLALPLLALGACSQSDTAPGPGGVTVGEARALDEAAAILDARRPPTEDATLSAPTPAEAAD
ncbi:MULTISPECIES: hypothetical protein [Novosphingobium]|jgi:hypothetical protein|uniref:Uncharacterized protein n=1 Tax=Novosphingobium panipatense TaxID=428991 RepID=A0ABY1QF12_9SPHN|nr:MULTISPECIES: hypothetical protein [Novosphingobium]SMP69475.1 hypothetical protein SAMN06296065_105112 [Novosphingobium panipatense]